MTISIRDQRHDPREDRNGQLSRESWQDLLGWFHNTLCEAVRVDPSDLDLVQLCNQPKAVVDAIFEHSEPRGLQPSPREQEIPLEM